MKLSSVFKILSALMLLTLLVAGCGAGKKNEKVVVLSPAFLELLYAVDGKAAELTSAVKISIKQILNWKSSRDRTYMPGERLLRQ